MPETDPGSLDRLHDIVVPVPVSWWPPAPGWYVVAGIGAAVFAAFAMAAFSQYRRNRYRREALRELARIPRDADSLPALGELLKRVALVAFPRERVASLTGDAWLQFLNETGRTADFARSPGSAFGTAQYRADAALDDREIPQLFDAVRTWIRNHRC